MSFFDEPEEDDDVVIIHEVPGKEFIVISDTEEVDVAEDDQDIIFIGAETDDSHIKDCYLVEIEIPLQRCDQPNSKPKPKKRKQPDPDLVALARTFIDSEAAVANPKPRKPKSKHQHKRVKPVIEDSDDEELPDLEF